MILLFLANAAGYISPVHDPWFNAQKSVIWPGRIGNLTLYAAEKPVSVLGCTDRTEICNAAVKGSGRCMLRRAGHMSDHVDAVTSQLQLTPRQVMVMGRIYNVLQNSVNTMAALGEDGGLLSSAKTDYWLSPTLPDNQWILELQNWFAQVLVLTQMEVVDYITGYEDPVFNRWIVPADSEEEWMCHNQIVQRDDYASFSVLGLAIIFCTGGLVLLVNMALSTVWPRLRPNTIAN